MQIKKQIFNVFLTKYLTNQFLFFRFDKNNAQPKTALFCD